MLTENELREVIKVRLLAVDGQTNKGLWDHTDGVMRGLLWALTGVDHGCYLTRDVAVVLTIAKIPFTINPENRLEFETCSPT